MSGFTASGGGVFEGVSGSNSAFTRAAIECDGSSSNPDQYYTQTYKWPVQSGDLYIHFEYAISNTAFGATDWIYLYDDNDVAVVRVIRGGQMQYLDNSAAWQNAGNAAVTGDSRIDHDIFVNVTTGELGFFVAGSRRAQTTGLSLGHISGISYARFYSSVGGSYYSQVVASTTPTIGGRLATYYPSGAGANSDWIGSYIDIDELRYDDADFAFSDTDGEVSTFAMTGPDLTGYIVQAVTVCARAKWGGTGPQNLQLALRASGANAFSSSIPLDVGYEPYCAVWETNPTTGSPWVNTQVASLQAGMKAVT